jgi:hypothetical protein
MPDVVAGVVAARRVREDELQSWNYVKGIRSVTLLGQAFWSVLVGRMVHTTFLGGLGAGTGPGQVILACVEPCDHPGEAVFVCVASSSSDAYASSVIHNRCG